MTDFVAGLLANTLGELVADVFGKTLKERADRRAIEAAVTRAEQQFALEHAVQMYRQSLDVGRPVGMGAHEASLLVRIARLELQLGHPESGRQYAIEALASGRKYRLPREQSEAEDLLRQLGEQT